MILLGLAGRAGSGKDSVADYLAARYGFIKFSFSDALYREITTAFGLPDDSLLRDRATKEVETPLLAMENCADDEFVDMVRGMFAPEDHTVRTPYSPRQILQWWGTEFRRAQDPDYWVARAVDWLARVHAHPKYPEHIPQLFVNTSVRFENEREWIHQLGGNVWHLHRENLALVAGHVSETPLPVLEGEREIWNNHTLEYLHLGVDQLLSSSAKFVRMEPPAPMVEPEGTSLDGITAHDGLLWRGDQFLSVFEADRLAQAHGFSYAEGLVRHLESPSPADPAEQYAAHGQAALNEQEGMHEARAFVADHEGGNR